MSTKSNFLKVPVTITADTIDLGKTDNVEFNNIKTKFIEIKAVEGLNTNAQEWKDENDNIVAAVKTDGRLYSTTGVIASAVQGGASVILWPNGGTRLISSQIASGSFNRTGGVYESEFIDTINNPFTPASVGHWIVIRSSNYKCALAKIEEYIDSSKVILYTINWDFDLVNIDYDIIEHPQVAVGNNHYIEFEIDNSGHVNIVSDKAFVGSQVSNAVFLVNTYAGIDEIKGANIETYAQGYSGIFSLEVGIHGGDLYPNDKVKGLVIELDDTESQNADKTTEYEGLKFVTTSVSNATHRALKVGVGFEEALTVAGSQSEDPNYGYEVTGTTIEDRVTGALQVGTAFLDTSTDNLQIFDNNNDYILIGSDNLFEIVGVVLDTNSSKNLNLEFYYSTGNGIWTTLVVEDGTNGFTNSGNLEFAAPVDWIKDDQAINDGDISNAYYIKIVRNYLATLHTLPIEQYFKIYESNSTGMKILGNGITQLSYRGTAPTDLVNGMTWMESDGLHAYYNDAEHVLT